MRRQAIDSLAAWPTEFAPPGGVLVLTGYGLDVRVWRGRLRVRNGIGRDRREALVHRATGRLRRLVVLGHTGSISLDAIRWLSDVGAAYLQLDADGRVLMAFGPAGGDRPALRRAQARALDTPAGNEIVRRLLAAKIAGQSETLRAMGEGDGARDAMAAAQAALEGATTRDELRLAEAQAATAYWGAWAAESVTFARRDADRVPAHWRTFGARVSPLTGNPRLAANPANALLNYLYAILEGEATIAARIVGLDPGIGLLHADQPSRDSLSADLMEPVRPRVDAFVLELLRKRSFAASDFHETRQGVCRITPPLARELAATAPEWGRAVGRIAEDVARWLEHRPTPSAPSSRGRFVSSRGRSDATPNASLPTRISGRNRSAGRGDASRGGHRPRPFVGRSCVWCGSPSPSGRRTCSPQCEEATRADGLDAFVAAGVDALRKHHAEGRKTELSDGGRDHLSTRTAEHVRAAREWQATHRWPTDPEYFAREIVPGLVDVPVRELVAATGLSAAYCRRIKRGEVVPHPMWWGRLHEAQSS